MFAVSAHLALDVGVGCQCWHVISAGAWRVAVVKFKPFPSPMECRDISWHVAFQTGVTGNSEPPEIRHPRPRIF